MHIRLRYDVEFNRPATTTNNKLSDDDATIPSFYCTWYVWENNNRTQETRRRRGRVKRREKTISKPSMRRMGKNVLHVTSIIIIMMNIQRQRQPPTTTTLMRREKKIERILSTYFSVESANELHCHSITRLSHLSLSAFRVLRRCQFRRSIPHDPWRVSHIFFRANSRGRHHPSKCPWRNSVTFRSHNSGWLRITYRLRWRRRVIRLESNLPSSIWLSRWICVWTAPTIMSFQHNS